jgi:hypothetical protein
MKFEFLDRFSKNTQVSNFMKIHSVGAESFYADGQKNGRTDGQTYMTKEVAIFHNFANAPNAGISKLKKN